MPRQNPLWKRNDIQFARLLSEIHAAGLLNDAAHDTLCRETALSRVRLDQLFARAESVWEYYKEQLAAHSDLAAAFKTVLDLAEENVVDEMIDWDEHNRQMLSIRAIDTYLNQQGIQL